jgi:hypothetical protein
MLGEVLLIQHKLFTLMDVQMPLVDKLLDQICDIVRSKHFDDPRMTDVFTMVDKVITILTNKQKFHQISTRPRVDEKHVVIIDKTIAVADCRFVKSTLESKHAKTIAQYAKTTTQHAETLKHLETRIDSNSTCLEGYVAALDKLQSEYHASRNIATIQAENTALKAKLAQMLDLLK